MKFIIGDRVRIKDNVPRFRGWEGTVKEVINTPFLLIQLHDRLSYFHIDYIEKLGTTGEGA